MAIFRAPPNQNDLVLNRGDILNVFDGGAATNTVINAGGLEQVFAGGTSENTIINAIGSERIDAGGTTNDTSINTGGREIVFGTANDTNIVGGREVGERGGVANDTTIGGNFGRLDVNFHGLAHNVAFSDNGKGSVELLNPLALTGTVTNWHVGDFIDLLDTRATAVSQTGNMVTVSYVWGLTIKQVTYTLVDQQPDTHVTLRFDGHGGTDLILTPIIGLQHLPSEAHLV